MALAKKSLCLCNASEEVSTPFQFMSEHFQAKQLLIGPGTLRQPYLSRTVPIIAWSTAKGMGASGRPSALLQPSTDISSCA